MIRVTLLYTIFLSFLHLVTAQQPTSTTNSSAVRYITTTISTTIPPSSLGASPTPTSLVLTLAVNGTSPTVVTNGTTSVDTSSNTTTIISQNTTLPIGTIIYSNSTILFPNSTLLFPNSTFLYPNGTLAGTNGTVLNPNLGVWDGTQSYLPFRIELDAAYGVSGAFLIVTGIPLAGLGGKNRWSSMAVVSGYSTLLLTLVLVLRFGVAPGIQTTPTPNPPSATLRGLYTLACIIASLVGAGAGVFWFNQTKYWVPAMGGFGLGWFIETFKRNGTTGGSIVGRWGLIGGLTVIVFILGLIPTLHYHLLLLSTAFIGATAFTLGVDCFTRAGLKEFYIYNLGFRSGLFPKLWVQEEGSVGRWEFPLLTIMQVEIGVLVAVFLVGAAIQYRVLGMLQVRLEKIKQEDEERKEREEEDRMASRFKDHHSDLEKWESKYGHGKGLGGLEDVPMHFLNKDQSDSTASLTRALTGGDSVRGLSGGAGASVGGSFDPGSMEVIKNSVAETRSLGRHSLGGQSIGRLPVMELGDGLAPSLGVENDVEAGRARAHGSGSPTSEMSGEERERMRLLDEISEVRKSIEVLRATTPTSIGMLSRSGSQVLAQGQRSRTQSALSIGGTSFASGLGGVGGDGRVSPAHALGAIGNTPTLDEGTGSGFRPPSRTHAGPQRTSKEKEWEDYLAERKLFTPPAGISAPIDSRNVLGRLSKVPDSVVRAMERRERAVSGYELGVDGMDEFGAGRKEGEVRESHTVPKFGRGSVLDFEREPRAEHSRESMIPAIMGHAGSSPPLPAGPASAPHPRYKPERTATYEELELRHRSKISQLQKPITEQMTDSIKLEEAKLRYNKMKEQEKREMAKREKERAERERKNEGTREELDRVPRENGVDRAAVWRQSVVLDHPQSDARQPEVGKTRPDVGGQKAAEGGKGRRQSFGLNRYVN